MLGLLLDLGQDALLGALVQDAGDIAVDSCTLNNALNVAQLGVLIALLRWVRPHER